MQNRQSSSGDQKSERQDRATPVTTATTWQKKTGCTAFSACSRICACAVCPAGSLPARPCWHSRGACECPKLSGRFRIRH